MYFFKETIITQNIWRHSALHQFSKEIRKLFILDFWRGGGSPFTFENTILSMERGDCLDNLRLVFGPCAQYCQWEASEKKVGQKLKIMSKSLYFYSIRFVSTSWSVWCVSDNKLPSYAYSKLGQKWRPGLFWAENWLSWPYFLRYGLKICFAHN